MLQHERLDVYTRALELLGHVRRIAIDELPRGSRGLAQRILATCSSLVVDIASAAGQPSVGGKRRAYGAAIHAATKAGAVLDVLRHLALIGEKEHVHGKEIVERIVAGLRRRIRMLEGAAAPPSSPRKSPVRASASSTTTSRAEKRSQPETSDAESRQPSIETAQSNGANLALGTVLPRETLHSGGLSVEAVMQT